MKYVIAVVLAVMLTGCAGDKIIGRYNDRPTANTYATNTAYTYGSIGNMTGFINYR